MRAFRMWVISRRRSPRQIVDVTKDASFALALEGKGWLVTPGTFTPDAAVVGKRKARR